MKDVIKTKMDNLIVIANRNKSESSTTQLCVALNNLVIPFKEEIKIGCAGVACCDCAVKSLSKLEDTAAMLVKINDLTQ